MKLESIDFSSEELLQLHRSIGLKVANIRKSKKVSQLDLALAIGYKSTSVISKAEVGTEERHFSVEQLYKIAKALNVEICEFLNFEQKTNNPKPALIKLVFCGLLALYTKY